MTSRSTPILLSGCLLAGCGSRGAPAPDKDPPPKPAVASATASAAASAIAPAPEAKKATPTLVMERFAPGGRKPNAVFAVEGALVVVEGGKQIGRVNGEAIEWLDKKIPPGSMAFGEPIIDSVHGRWPDRIDVLYSNANPRAPVPGYFPLTGKGSTAAYGAGGTSASIAGVATIGESTIVAGFTNFEGTSMPTVRGPKLVRKPKTPKEAGCKDIENLSYRPRTAAVFPHVIGASRAGSLVVVGNLCEDQRAIELWDKDTREKIIDLSTWVKGSVSMADLVPGDGDVLYLRPNDESPIFRIEGGEATPLPKLARGVKQIFVSPDGHVHANDGRTIHRFDTGAWVPVAELAWNARFRRMVMDGETIWVSTNGEVGRLREDKTKALGEGCKTPFVYLYDVNIDNAKNFTFPTTQKALATFPEVGDISLVEVEEDGWRRLGVTVKSSAQGEAVMAHVKATMKNEEPRMLCYAPRSPRGIPIPAAKGK